MFELTVPWWELVLRAAIMYIALIVLIRISGKRQIGELSPFDLILLLILSEAVQNAMNAGEESVTGGLILVCTLIGLNSFIGYITYKSKKAEDIIEGKPEILIRNGKLIESVAEDARITESELKSALRENGVFRIEDVKLAILENNGSVTVQSNDDKSHSIPSMLKKYR
ncbi:MAG TPA: YetF domain-containing protein [Methylophilaceae bacterium]|nr:YetF domain-containing protein [Methylophilaceae bacterium]